MKTILIVFISLGLFLGGTILLALRYAFWSLFLGLPSVITGIVFIIFTFDKLSQKEIDKELGEIHQVPCDLCKRPTFTREPETKGICGDCDKKLLEKMEEIKSS